jgi:hypothetical protein
VQVNTYDTSLEDVPQYSSVATIMFGTFPLDPLAVRYSEKHETPEFLGLEFTESWNAGDLLPDSLLLSSGADYIARCWSSLRAGRPRAFDG